MGDNYIDSFNPYSLHDVVDGTMPEPEDHSDDPADFPVTEFYGLHITYLGNDEYQVVYDGHAGRVEVFDQDEYDDVLELVDSLMRHIFEIDHRDFEGLVEYAGRQITEDESKVEENPDLYLLLPAGV